MNFQKEAEDHVNWLLKTLKPLLISHMLHGYKHGVQDCVKPPCRTEIPQSAIKRQSKEELTKQIIHGM